MEKHFVVTGATGFIGSEVVARLLKSCAPPQITMLVRRVPQREDSLFRLRLKEHGLAEIFPQLRFVECDFQDPQAFARSLAALPCDPRACTVIHMAAMITGAGASPAQQARINVGLTQDLLDWVKGGHHFIYLSSVVAFGAVTHKDLRSEKDFPNFPELCRDLAYFRTKREAHETVERSAQLPTHILCPSIVHGALEHFKDSRGHLQSLRQGRLRFAPSGGGNFVGLDRVAAQIVQAAQLVSPAGKQTQLLVDANMTYREYFERYLNLYQEFRAQLARREHSRSPSRLRALPALTAPALRTLLPWARRLGLKRKLADVLYESTLYLWFKSEHPLAPTAGLDAALRASFASMPLEID